MIYELNKLQQERDAIKLQLRTSNDIELVIDLMFVEYQIDQRLRGEAI